MKKQIQDFSLGYSILLPICNFATHCHYHHIVVRGKNNIPTQGTYIIAPCHQNALMEPMAVLYFMHQSTVFLARADIFAKPTIRNILTFLKILPVYRIRDGKSSLSKNEEIFAASKQVLLDHVPLCLMAEGRHNDRHQLLPLVKGMFRIAGETQRTLRDEPLYIVPTGIDFDHYEHPYSNLVVNIGKPIPVQNYMEQFESDEPVALNQMRTQLTTALQQQMHHVASKTYYEEVYALCLLLNRSWRRGNRPHNSEYVLSETQCNQNKTWARFYTRQQIANYFNHIFNDNNESTSPIIHKTRAWINLCNRYHLDIYNTAEPWHPLTTIGMTLLLAAIAIAMLLFPTLPKILLSILLCNPIILLPTHLLTKKTIKDPQFRSSVNYGIRLILSLLYIITYTIIIGCWQGWSRGILALFIGLATARLNAIIHPILRQWMQNLHLAWIQLSHRSDMRKLRQLQHEILSFEL